MTCFKVSCARNPHNLTFWHRFSVGKLVYLYTLSGRPLANIKRQMSNVKQNTADETKRDQR